MVLYIEKLKNFENFILQMYLYIVNNNFNFNFTDISDFLSVTMIVTFGPGESIASINVTIVNNTIIENTNMFSATLTAVSNAVIGIDGTAIVTILDDDRKFLTSLL